MTTYDKNTNIIRHEDGREYNLDNLKKPGRRPGWVTKWVTKWVTEFPEVIPSHTSQKEKSQSKPKMAGRKAKSPKPAKSVKKNNVTTIWASQIYKNFLTNFNSNSNHYIYNNNIQTIKHQFGVRSLKINIQFDLTQTGLENMIFNSDFNNTQKVDPDGNLIISSQCFNRKVYGANNLQDNFSIDGMIGILALLRGGIHTDKLNKKRNASIQKSINTRVVSKSFTVVSDDKLGAKSDENGDNFLTTEILYKDVVFHCEHDIYINTIVGTIQGFPRAQESPLKIIQGTPDEIQKFIDEGTFTTNGMIDCDKIIKIVSEKLQNLINFTHSGDYAEFSLDNLIFNVVERT
jgi:hypothetical protein